MANPNTITQHNNALWHIERAGTNLNNEVRAMLFHLAVKLDKTLLAESFDATLGKLRQYATQHHDCLAFQILRVFDALDSFSIANSHVNETRAKLIEDLSCNLLQ